MATRSVTVGVSSITISLATVANITKVVFRRGSSSRGMFPLPLIRQLIALSQPFAEYPSIKPTRANDREVVITGMRRKGRSFFCYSFSYLLPLLKYGIELPILPTTHRCGLHKHRLKLGCFMTFDCCVDPWVMRKLTRLKRSEPIHRWALQKSMALLIGRLFRPSGQLLLAFLVVRRNGFPTICLRVHENHVQPRFELLDQRLTPRVAKFLQYSLPCLDNIG